MWTPELDPATQPLPLYQRIARALERDIRERRLAAGARLPTHRELADHLGVAVGTVSRAYAAAQRAGWLRGEVGRGSFVGTGDEAGSDRLGMETGFELDLSLNVPVAAGTPDLAAALRGLARRSDLAHLMRYQASEGGAPADRQAGVELLRRHGVETSIEEVVLCAGAQHGLNVALDAAGIGPNDAVAAAELTWPGLRALADRRGIRLVALRLDEQGVVPAALEEACLRAPIRALYVVPTYQNPTGATLTESRRRQLAQLAERFNFLVIEDDIHRLLVDDRPSAITALAPDHGIHVASASKCLSPGLRIAYLAVPPRLRERAIDAVWTSVWNVAPLMAALASRWICDGTLDEVVAQKREEARRRQALAREILAPSGAGKASTAYHFWLDLGKRGDATRFTAHAASEGIRVTPASAFHIGQPKPAPQAVRLALGAAATHQQLRRGLQTLARLRRDVDSPVTVRA